MKKIFYIVVSIALAALSGTEAFAQQSLYGLRLQGDNSGDVLTLKAPSGMTSYTLTLPSLVPAGLGSLLYASNGSGVTAWTAAGANGDVLIFSGGVPAWLAPGTSGQVLTISLGGVPTWTNAPGTGTVTSVALALPSIFSVSGSPLTSSGTLTGTLANQSANTIFAGPASGLAAAPTFRTLVAADIAGLSAYIQNTYGNYVQQATSSFNISDSGSAKVFLGHDATSTGSGSALTVRGGNALTSGTGGALSLSGGSPGITGSSGSVTISTPNGSGIAGAGGAISITAGNGVSTGASNGGAIFLTAGNAGTAGASGNITMTAGTASGTTSSTGGNITITSGQGSGSATGSSGGNMTLSAGSGVFTSGTGGNAVFSGGNSALSAGGSDTVRGGDAVAGTGGALILRAGNSGGINNNGSPAYLTGGAAGTTGTGGTAQIQGGAGGTTSGAGGVANIFGGTTTSGAGGGVVVTAANAATLGNGGSISMTAGTSAGATGAAGTISLNGGNSGAATVAGGAVTITGGTGSTTGSGGDVNIAGGLGSGTGANGGAIVFKTASTNSATEAVRITNSGYVGIGTNSPDKSLDINGGYATRHTNVTLVTGSNDNVAVGNTSYLRIVGPTGAFTLKGLAAGSDGQRLRLINTTGNDMTISYKGSSTAANNIETNTGGDVIVKGTVPVLDLVYDSLLAEWLLGTLNANQVIGGVGGIIYTVKANDQNVLNNAVPANSVDGVSGLADLNFSVGANQTWEINGELDVANTNKNIDFQFDFTLPAGSTAQVDYTGIAAANGAAIKGEDQFVANNAATTQALTCLIDAGNPTLINVRGIISTTASGTIQLQWSQGTANNVNQTTLKKGSYMKIIRVK